MLSDRCPICLSVCDVGVLWPNGWTDQDETWHAGRPWPRPHCVRWGPSGDPATTAAPPQRRHPQFSAHICCGQMAGWIKMPLGTEVGLDPDYIVLDGDTAPLPKTGGRAPPKFSAYLYCGQTAGCIKMPLGTEVGLSPGDIVFDVDPATPRKRAHPPHPIFGLCLLPNGWMDEDAAWYGSRPRPRPHCTRRGPSSRERGTAAPSFRPMSE